MTKENGHFLGTNLGAGGKAAVPDHRTQAGFLPLNIHQPEDLFGLGGKVQVCAAGPDNTHIQLAAGWLQTLRCGGDGQKAALVVRRGGDRNHFPAQFIKKLFPAGCHRQLCIGRGDRNGGGAVFARLQAQACRA